MEDTARAIHSWASAGGRTVFARVVELSSFGGSSQAELLAVNELGETAGELLAGTVDAELLPAMHGVRASPPRHGLRTLTVEVHGEAVIRAARAAAAPLRCCSRWQTMFLGGFGPPSRNVGRLFWPRPPKARPPVPERWR